MRRTRMTGTLLAAMVAVAGLGLSGPVHGEDDVSEDAIVFGQSAAFEGPARQLGLGMRQGLRAAFAEANEDGGVKGRRLELVAYDDGYEPDAAIKNTRRLIEEDRVFSLIGEVGTPTSKAVVPIAEEAGVPFIGPFTGAAFLRDPGLETVVNVRGSYNQETEAWIQHLTEDLGAERIAILYQDDSFGRAGLRGVEAAMQRRDMELVARGTYRRNTTAVKSAVMEIRRADPDAVVMVGAYEPCAEFIRLSKRLGVDATYVNISFVGSKALAAELGPKGRGVVITQVVPFPWNTSVPLVADYHAALKAHAPKAEPGFVSLEGYLVGRFAIAALKRVEGEITRENLLRAIRETGTFDIGGAILEYGPDDNQGLDEVFLSVINEDGSFAAVDRLSESS